MPTTFRLSSNPANLRTYAPHATVEAEYGDEVVTGSILTFAHHGPRKGQPAPCSYSNDVGDDLPIASVVGLSHVDLDTIGGCAAILGCKPESTPLTSAFWNLAEFVDTRGPHRIGQWEPPGGDVAGIRAACVRALNAYWAWGAKPENLVFAPRDGSVADVTQAVLNHIDAVRAILLDHDDDMLAAGDAYAAAEADLNRSSFVEAISADGVTTIFRRSDKFVNHLYTAPDGVTTAHAVVTLNTKPDNGAITLSLADPVPGVSCADLMKRAFGPLAGGHDGIAGSPRGEPQSEGEARRVFKAIRLALMLALTLNHTQSSQEN